MSPFLFTFEVCNVLWQSSPSREELYFFTPGLQILPRDLFWTMTHQPWDQSTEPLKAQILGLAFSQCSESKGYHVKMPELCHWRVRCQRKKNGGASWLTLPLAEGPVGHRLSREPSRHQDSQSKTEMLQALRAK